MRDAVLHLTHLTLMVASAHPRGWKRAQA